MYKGVEAELDGYPGDSSDSGLPASADEVCSLRLTVGDSSPVIATDAYILTVGPVNCYAPYHEPIKSIVYNQFRPGQRYPISIVWMGNDEGGVDYDYIADVEAVSLPTGVIIQIEDPYTILGNHFIGGDTPIFYAANKTAYVNLIKPDLRIYNGGNNSSMGALVSEADEENIGAYLLVNSDDDNGNDSPDLYESNPGFQDDDLARLDLSLLPTGIHEGTLELIKTSGSIKLWQDQSKTAEQTMLSWDLATTSPPTTLWIEGIGRSTAERDIELELRYTNGSNVSSDEVKMTVVMVNLGNAVYREINKTGVPEKERGHAALIYKYLGNCTRDDFNNADNFRIIEMSGPTDSQSLTTMTSYPGYPCYGCYTNISDITYAKRLAIINTAKQLVARAPLDYEWNDALLPVNWNGSLANISSLRCDGLVEVCYELNGIEVWAMERNYEGTSYNYDISDQTDVLSYNEILGTWSAGNNNAKDNLEEHDDFDGAPGDWYDTLMPATQCGKVTPVEAVTKFSKQDLCQPIGHKGGN